MSPPPNKSGSPTLIIALDHDNAQQALDFCKRLDPQRHAVKLGPMLLMREGLETVRRIVRLGFRVFLDMKWHDIPSVTASACAAAAELGVWMVNVHALGGPGMLKATRAALPQHENGPLLVAVTILTSLDETEFQRLGWRRKLADQVLLLASLAHEQKLDGVVCSAHEAPRLRAAFGPAFRIVSPGIRTAHTAHNDQARVMTPAIALANGVDHLVIGRSITRARDPQAALRTLENELEQDTPLQG